MNHLTKNEILKIIHKSQSIAFPFNDLRHPFGFKRMDGMELYFRMFNDYSKQLDNVVDRIEDLSKREEQIQTASPTEVHRNIEIWCMENNIKCDFNYETYMYIFSNK